MRRRAFEFIALTCLLAASKTWSDPPPPAAADAETANEAPRTLPQDGFFSSIKQSLRQGDEEVVRGHFDLGFAPNEHRYYCLVDPKSGRREPNGVLGDPIPRKDGMTGIKSSAVSLYNCDKAEQQGLLVSSGYVLLGRAGARPARVAAAAPEAPVPPPAPAATPPQVAVPAPLPVPAELSVDKIDVAGVKLGMSPDEVRTALKSKKLHDYKEWTENLSYLDSTKGGPQPIPNGRFVNVVAAWTPAAASGAADVLDGAGESFEVMFTPVPGRERAMAIVRTVAYSPTNALRETALESGLVKKYGGYTGAGDIPESPTWRYQHDGSVQLGDGCSRRSILGGIGGVIVSSTPRENLSLKKSSDELRYELEHCGVAIVTEDHFTANSGAVHEDRIVTRFTVTAYSPLAASDGAKTAAQIIQSASHAANGAAAPSAKDDRAPDL
jgi:hypothetical protein